MDLAADEHAKDLSAAAKTGHTGADGSKPQERLSRHGVWYGMVGELLAYRDIAPELIVAQLLVCDGSKSRLNRNMILNPEVLVCGIAYSHHLSLEHVAVVTVADGYGPEPYPRPTVQRHAGVATAPPKDFRHVLESVPSMKVHGQVIAALRDGSEVSIDYKPGSATVTITEAGGKTNSFGLRW